ncbi:MAG TPA: redoxin family protein [Candidatus Dormibacteraeota bacterium]|nr:redoxin family protein [Candidatus Dormibacteraeota bacterium]
MLAIVVLWAVPRLQQPTGTLVVVGAARSATTLPATALSLRQAGTWSAVGNVSGAVPAAPDQRQLLVVSLASGTYDAVRLGGDAQPLKVVITAGQVEPLLLGIGAGRLIPGAAYAGNDDVNLGLGELSGKFVSMDAFHLSDQHGGGFDLSSIAGKDVVIAAFHTTCHETCPLYTALFFQLAKRLPPDVMLAEVTTDPATDTQAVLSSYATQLGATWSFVTGTSGELQAFWAQFGVELATGDTHTSTLALVDRHGYVRLVYRGVPDVGHDVPPSLVTSLSAQGLSELAAGGDGWGAPDVLEALATIGGGQASSTTGGGRAPDFRLGATDGTAVSLASLAGKPLVINFWATYCPPCKAEMPLLQKDVGQSGARLVLVNEGESRDVAAAFLRSLGIEQPSLLDSDLGVGRAYGVSAFPTTVFVKSDGTIDRKQVGELSEGVLASELSVLSTQ